MKQVYVWLTRLIALGVVAQAAFVAWGTFDVFNAVDGGQVFTDDTEYNAGQAMHSVFGIMVIPLLALLLLIVSFFARVSRGVVFALLVLGLVALQIGLGFGSFPAPWVGLLHGINAFVLAGVAGFAGGLANRGEPGGGAPPDRTPAAEGAATA